MIPATAGIITSEIILTFRVKHGALEHIVKLESIPAARETVNRVKDSIQSGKKFWSAMYLTKG